MQTQITSFEAFLTPIEVGELLKITPRQVIQLARTGQIPAFKVGKFWRFRPRELDTWKGKELNSAREVCRS